jgi:hypothetical protein
MFSALLLQRAKHDNHLFRTELLNKHPEPTRLLRRALTNKRGDMRLQSTKSKQEQGSQHCCMSTYAEVNLRNWVLVVVVCDDVIFSE